MQYNKAIVGKNAFAHESGIHQDGMLKNAQTYEIMMPESVGVSKTSLVMGKHSGRAAFRNKLEELGYKLAGNQQISDLIQALGAAGARLNRYALEGRAKLTLDFLARRGTGAK